MTLLCLRGGSIYDPANGIDGEIRDLWIRDGVVIEPPGNAERSGARILDVTGDVVMPGGVDMHCHIAGSKVNTARMMAPDRARDSDPVRRTEILRSGTGGVVPSTFATGALYAGLGYTTAFDAAIPPLGSRHAHEELDDTPMLDTGFFVLTGNNEYLLEQMQKNEPERLRNFLGWLLGRCGGYAAKIVNPGGVEVWKQSGGNATGLDDPVTKYEVTPRQILQSLSLAATELNLPHPVHVHCNNLGLPGNAETTLETMSSLEGRRGHLTHIQFHSYGGDPDDQSTFRSEVPRLAEYINTHSDLSVDVGQVMFGETLSMTGDGAVGHYLHRVTGRPWYSSDLECEAGCGIVPITYKNKSFVHALQWAIGLEWYLLVDDPWRIAMSTDHPNGGSFLAYPEIISLLMDRSKREAYLDRLPGGLREACSLHDLTREYSLTEIAIITRAAPARLLGLPSKGHLGPGADADVTVYRRRDDLQEMFEMPHLVLKGGEMIVENCEIRTAPTGGRETVRPDFDEGHLPHIREWFNRHYTIQFENQPHGWIGASG